MNQDDVIVEMLSEHRAGSKLKRISIAHADETMPSPNLSEVKFFFEDGEDTERIVMVWGKDLGVGFGWVELPKKEESYN